MIRRISKKVKRIIDVQNTDIYISMMRPTRQLKIITSHVEVLTDLQKQVDELLNYIKSVTQKAVLWIDEKENSLSFMEINQFLADETNVCIQKCLKITSENQDLLHTTGKDDRSYSSLNHISVGSSLDGFGYQTLVAKLEEVDRNISFLKESSRKNEENYTNLSTLYESLNTVSKKHSRKLKNMKHKLEDQEKQSATFIKKQEADVNNNTLKFNEIWGELTNASEFLHRKTESFSAKISEMELKLINMTNTVDPLNQNFEDVSATITRSIMLIEPMIQENAQNNISFQQQISTIDSKIQDMSSQLETLSVSADRSTAVTSIAFNARVKDETIELSLNKDHILTCFDGVMYNIGHCYNPETGIFTAPCDGFYLCSIMVDVNVEENLQFGIKRKAKFSGKEFLLATTHTKTKDSMVCDVGIVDMFKDDQLFVKPHRNHNKVRLSTYSHFMCILINKY